MAVELPYLSSYKNVGALFDRIASAKVPEGAFSTVYLAQTIGLKSTTDRALIPLLKAMGFLDPTGNPTADYMALKNPQRAPGAIASGIRRAYAPLFSSNEKANELDASGLKGLIGQITGAEAGTVSKTLGTLQALLKKATFAPLSADDEAAEDGEPPEVEGAGEAGAERAAEQSHRRGGGMRSEFHYNIQIHLPSNATEDTYLHIFNAMRKAFVL